VRGTLLLPLLLLAGCASADRPAVRVAGTEIGLEDVVRETQAQIATRGEDLDRIAPDRAYAYASQVAVRLADRIVLESRASAGARVAAAARADDAVAQGVRIPGLPAGSVREAIYMDSLVGTLVPAGDDVERILAVWRAEAGLSVFIPYDRVATSQGPLPVPGEIAAMAALGVLVAAAGGLLLRRAGAGRWAFAALGLGTLLRVVFWAGTPWDWLAHDAAGHLEYVQLLAERWRLPGIAEGWQTYQPPLYHAIAAALGLVTPRALQNLGLVVSIATLAVGLGIVRLAVPDRLRAGLPVAFLFFAAHPSLVLAAPRVNNDGLSTLLGFAAVLFALRGRRGGRTLDWALAAAAAGLALLTKNVGFLLLPILGILVLLEPTRDWRSKVRIGVVSIAIVSLLSGWLVVRRFGGEAQRDLVANVGALSPSLAVEVTPATLLAFHPARMIREPYVNPFVAGPARDRLGEYVLRSSLFGEFTFARVPIGLARALLGLATAIALLASLGAAREIRRHRVDATAMAVVALVVVLGAVAYLPAAPYATSMDFRYLTLLLLPGAAFLAAAPSPRVVAAIVSAFVALATTALAILSF
jgi:hypothetical protein